MLTQARGGFVLRRQECLRDQPGLSEGLEPMNGKLTQPKPNPLVHTGGRGPCSSLFMLQTQPQEDPVSLGLVPYSKFPRRDLSGWSNYVLENGIL